ncbi:MAG: hypothetical protein AAF598_01900, partial [Bacteroidota bacterium]
MTRLQTALTHYQVFHKLSRITLASFFFLMTTNFLQAQNPYQLRSSTEIPIIGGGATLLGITIGLNKKSKDLTPADTIGLDIYNLPSIDRKVVYNWSKRAQKTSDRLLYTSPIAPLTFPLLAG